MTHGSNVLQLSVQVGTAESVIGHAEHLVGFWTNFYFQKIKIVFAKPEISYRYPHLNLSWFVDGSNAAFQYSNYYWKLIKTSADFDTKKYMSIVVMMHNTDSYSSSV